jgi:hypothetical protein
MVKSASMAAAAASTRAAGCPALTRSNESAATTTVLGVRGVNARARASLSRVIGEGHSLRGEGAAVVVDSPSQARTAAAIAATTAGAAGAPLGDAARERQILDRQRTRSGHGEQSQ